VVFATGADMDRTVGEILTSAPGHGRGEESPLPRATVLSGVTEKELSTIMAAWKHLGLPRQNWATLTPTSEGWPLIDLLTELDLERVALSPKVLSGSPLHFPVRNHLGRAAPELGHSHPNLGRLAAHRPLDRAGP